MEWAETLALIRTSTHRRRQSLDLVLEDGEAVLEVDDLREAMSGCSRGQRRRRTEATASFFSASGAGAR